MSQACFAVFETPLGTAAIVWRGPAIIGFRLPGDDNEQHKLGVARRHPDAVEAPLAGAPAMAADAVIALLNGAPGDLLEFELELPPATDPTMAAALLEARKIPPGKTATYGEIARRIGDPSAARRVGQAMARNPIPVFIPCHRVMGEGGRLVGFSAPGGVDTKLRLLEIEGALKAPLFGPLPLARGPIRS